MSNDIKPVTPNGIGGVLTTLASSGDNWVKLLIVGGLILNGIWTKNNGKGISSNSADIDAMRKQIAEQVSTIHKNQKIYLRGINEARANHAVIMEKLGIQVAPYYHQKQEEQEQQEENEQ